MEKVYLLLGIAFIIILGDFYRSCSGLKNLFSETILSHSMYENHPVCLLKVCTSLRVDMIFAFFGFQSVNSINFKINISNGHNLIFIIGKNKFI